MTKRIKSVGQDYIGISGSIEWETEKAILFYDGKIKVWIPKSQIEDIEWAEKIVTITIPEWLAIKCELL